MQCSDIVVGMVGDVCVIAPTGSGKSVLWLLPLLVQKDGISLVITPYTSLGVEGEQR
jgi:superfamily II DNA helicase RecQ